MIVDVTIGRYLKDVRVNKNGGKGYWSRLAVATRAHVSDEYLYQLEEGQRGKPSPDILLKLAPALQESYVKLLMEAGYLSPSDLETMSQTPAHIQRLIYLASRLPQNKIEALISFLE